MGMIIAWQFLNKATYPQDKRFSKSVLIIAPGLTVKSRLKVLVPAGSGNYYEEFSLIPPGLHDKMRTGKVLIHNWHTLMPLDPDSHQSVFRSDMERLWFDVNVALRGMMAEMKGVDRKILEKFYASQSKEYREQLEGLVAKLVKKYQIHLMLDFVIFHKEFQSRNPSGVAISDLVENNCYKCYK